MIFADSCLLSGQGAGGGDTRLKYEDEGGAVSQYHNSRVSRDGLPSQKVPEMKLSYMNSNPKDISAVFGGKSVSELTGSLGGGSEFASIPTNIPMVDNVQCEKIII